MISHRRRFSMVPFAALLFGGIALFTAPAGAAPGVVVTHTGARYEGDVTERLDDVVVTIRGVQTIIQRGDVASITFTESFDQQFKERLARLESNDIESRIALARWAMEREQYIAARDVLDQVLQIDPNHGEADELATIVRGQLRLSMRKPAPAVDRQRSVPATRAVEGATEEPLKRLLSADEVQSLRRAEWRPGDIVRVRVDTRVARQFAQDFNRPWREFGSRRAGDQAQAILQEGTPQHQRGVQILNDPPVMVEFRRSVQPIILNGCASSGCHGGPNPSTSFALVTPADNETATATNFYLLMTASRRLDAGAATGDGGIFGGASDVRMIDRGRGAKSLLVQYALPAEIAEFDHPPVQNFRPIFQNLSDPRARAVVDWIDSLAPITPDYGFTFTLSSQIEGMTGPSETDAPPATRPGGNRN